MLVVLLVQLSCCLCCRHVIDLYAKLHEQSQQKDKELSEVKEQLRISNQTAREIAWEQLLKIHQLQSDLERTNSTKSECKRKLEILAAINSRQSKEIERLEVTIHSLRLASKRSGKFGAEEKKKFGVKRGKMVKHFSSIFINLHIN